ncbi:MAG: bifunctional precorrin-2 dehydrogenase/sirohydrochlorin ferrochelatase [Thermoplasmata archaeon]
MLIDLRVRGKVAVVVGGGEPARSRARMLAKEGAKVTLLPGLSPRERGSKRKKAGASSPSDPIDRIRRVRPTLVFLTVRGDAANPGVQRAAHSVGALVHVYDTPALCDFTLPSVGAAGAIRVAVSSSGYSPAMAALLRRRIERRIQPVDVAMVRLQGRLRETILSSLPTHEARKRTIYRILRHREIRRLLRAGRFAAAVALARKIIRSSARDERANPGKG